MPDVNVPGSDNFVIVAGRDVYLSTAPAAPPTGDDRRNLVNLLGHVRRIWITGVLERSVRHAALLDPQVRMDPAAVEPRWRRYVEAAGPPGDVLSPDRSIGRVFDDAGQMLLVLGEPGAGKTITLLTLARACIERAERDPAAPVPVVLNLSSWTGAGPFHDWLVGELSKGYGVGKALARRWLEHHRLLLLLDGLDEVGEDRRAGCVQALHAFVEEHGVPGLAVCCRSAEYAALPLRLKLGGAVLLLPLEQAQIDAYLDAAGPGLDGLRAALAGNAELRGLCESPLMLSIMTLAFHGLSADALRFHEAATPEELRDEVFGRFVDRMFMLRERPDGRFSRRRVGEGLHWLARGMRERGSIFAVELLQPEWLTRPQLLLYTLGSRIGGVMAIAVAIGAVCLGGLVVIMASGETSTEMGSTALVTLGAAVAMGLLAGLFYAPFGYHDLRRPPGPRPMLDIGRDLAAFLAYLAAAGLAALLVVGMGRWGLGLSMREPPLLTAFVTVSATALCLPLIFRMKAGRGTADRDIGLAGTLSWRWRPAIEMMLVCAVGGALVFLLAPVLDVPRLIYVAITPIALFTAVTYAGWRQEVPPVDRWRDRSGNSALRDSGRVFAFAGLGCVLALWPLLAMVVRTEQPLRDSFGLAVLLATVLFSPALFWFGGIDLVLHGVLRLVLALTGTMPLRLRRFLDYAAHLGFMRRAGGGYIFHHRLLLEHFAARPAPGAAAGQPAGPSSLHLSEPSIDAMANMSNVHVSGDGNTVLSGGRDVNLNLSGPAQPAGDGAPAPAPPTDTPVAERILFLAANSTRRPLDLELELRRIEEHLLQGSRRDRFVLKAVPAVTVDALMRTMMEEAPTHVHFSGHGRSEGIMLRDELGNPRLVSGRALESLFELCGSSVRCVVLNACYSEPQARSIRKHVPHVVGSTDRISDAAALSFSSGFYLAVAAGMDVPYAFKAGKLRMQMDNVPGEEHLVLL